MQTEKLAALLRKSRADGWEITDTRTTGREFYFIRHKLDQHRFREVRTTAITLYRAFGDGAYLGSASAVLPPTAGEEEAVRLISQLENEALFAKSPFYHLPKPDGKTGAAGVQAAAADGQAGAADGKTDAPDGKADGPVGAAGKPDEAQIAEDYIRVMASLPESAEADINSYEIFADSVEEHFLNSEGIDHVQYFPHSLLEAVVNARSGAHEIELYRLIEAGACDSDGIRAQLEAALRAGQDRLSAVPTPSLSNCPVLFPALCAGPLYEYLIRRVNAAAIYQGLSDWKVGSEGGGCVTVRSVRELPGSPANRFYDEEGLPVLERVLIDRGRPVSYWGSARFCSCLGMKEHSLAGNFICEGDGCDEALLRSDTYLEAAEFSDFQCDPVTGDIAGELRLGYLHENGQVRPVTGGSVSGSMAGSLSTMRCSAELTLTGCRKIPALTRLENMAVTGAEQG